MAPPGRGRIACTATAQTRLLWLVEHGWRIQPAAAALGMSANAVYRHAQRDPTFRARLSEALRHGRFGRRR